MVESSKGKNNFSDLYLNFASEVQSSQPHLATLYLKKLIRTEPGNLQAYEFLASLQKKLQYYSHAIETAHAGLQAYEQKKNADPKIRANLLCIEKFSKLESNPSECTINEFKDLHDYLSTVVGSSDENLKTLQQIVKNFPGNHMKQEKTTQQKQEEAQTVAQLLQKNRLPEGADEKVYLLSGEWFNKWKDYVDYNAATGQTADHHNFMEEEKKITFLGPIDQSSIIDDVDLLIDPESSEDYANYPVKLGLNENKDFLILDQQLWDFFYQRYGGVAIPRFTYFKSENDFTPSVEVWLQKINVVMFPLPTKTQNRNIEKYDVVYISRRKTIRDLMQKLNRIYGDYISLKDKNGSDIPRRLWKIDPLCDFRTYVPQLMLDRTNGLLGRVLNEDHRIEDAEISEEDVLLLELKVSMDWLFAPEERSPMKKNAAQTTSARTKPELKELIKHFDISVDKSFKNTSRKGLTGLQNLGNTCFMNSALQCMSNTYDLTEYFLDNSFVHDLNPKNALGTGGRLAVAYAELLKEIWYGNSSHTSPWDFKKVIGKFASQFHGYGQQDSQELLSYLLDGLHEDLNRVKDKPSVETIESNDRPDAIVAKESWINHLKRNSSRVQELMHGQYKSRLDCPDCKRISITFDPFMMLSLPISTVEYSKFFLYFVFDDPKIIPTKITVNVPNSTPYEEIVNKICETTNAKPQNIVVGLLKDHRLIEKANDEADAYYLKEHAGIPFVYEIPDLSKESMSDKRLLVNAYVYAEPKNFYETEKMVSFTRLVVVDNTFRVKDVHLKIFEKMRRHINVFYEKSSKKSPIDLESTAPEQINKEYLEIFNDFDEANWPYKLYFNREEGKGAIKKFGKSKLLPTDDNNLFEFLARENVDLDCFVLEIKITKNTKIEFLGLNSCKELDNRSDSEGSAKGCTLQACLNLFTRKEKLDKDNAWYCNKCKEHKQATKKMEIWKTPDILIMHLKRFKTSRVSSIGSYYFSSGSKKITELVDFPIKGLDMSSYVLSPENGSNIYDLYGVVNHYGSLGGGHYTAYAKNKFDGKWHDFNDSRVSDASEREIVSAAAYVLFYKRRKSDE